MMVLRQADTEVGYQPMSLTDVANGLRAADDTYAAQWVLISEFLEELRDEDSESRAALIAPEPPTVDGAKWDVFLGALAEYVAIRSNISVPAWSVRPHRVWCGAVWFLSSLQSVRACALATSPASFRARGIFLEEQDLLRDGMALR